jgi:hypothetical protein
MFSFVRIDEGFISMWESRKYTDEDSVKMQQSLFEHLCPLLIIRLLPLRVFNDLSSSVLYGQLPSESIAHGLFVTSLSLFSFLFLPLFLLPFTMKSSIS